VIHTPGVMSTPGLFDGEKRDGSRDISGEVSAALKRAEEVKPDAGEEREDEEEEEEEGKWVGETGDADEDAEAKEGCDAVVIRRPVPTPLPRISKHASEKAEERGPDQKVVYPDGSQYCGQWLDGRCDGHGKLIWPDGRAYEGEFRKGCVHGFGLYKELPNGSTYVGKFASGKKTGKGTYTFPEGSVYEGEFKDDRIHGHGTYIWTGGGNGRKYSGQWVKSKMNGKGDFTFADGRMYSGQYVDGREHGYGTFHFPDGSKLQGFWMFGRLQEEASCTERSSKKLPEIIKNCIVGRIQSQKILNRI